MALGKRLETIHNAPPGQAGRGRTKDLLFREEQAMASRPPKAGSWPPAISGENLRRTLLAQRRTDQQGRSRPVGRIGGWPSRSGRDGEPQFPGRLPSSGKQPDPSGETGQPSRSGAGSRHPRGSWCRVLRPAFSTRDETIRAAPGRRRRIGAFSEAPFPHADTSRPEWRVPPRCQPEPS